MRCAITPVYAAKLLAMSPEERTELYGRLTLWRSTTSTVRHLLETAKRMYNYAQRGAAGVVRDVSTADAYECSDHLPVLAAVLFETVSNDGKAAARVVAGNRERRVKELRESVMSVAYPDPVERKDFDDLAAKLKVARDSMIAHAQGEAFKVSHGMNITTLWPLSAAVERADVDPWLTSLRPLEESVTAHLWTLKGG